MWEKEEGAAAIGRVRRQGEGAAATQVRCGGGGLGRGGGRRGSVRKRIV